LLGAFSFFIVGRIRRKPSSAVSGLVQVSTAFYRPEFDEIFFVKTISFSFPHAEAVKEPLNCLNQDFQNLRINRIIKEL